MPRVLWFSLQLCILLFNCLWNRSVNADEPVSFQVPFYNEDLKIYSQTSVYNIQTNDGNIFNSIIHCWYNNARFRESHEVTTAEPCLNCTCSKATLVCYLRVCPKLPNPPPSGCILLYRYRTCCPELICQDTPMNSYYIEARSEAEDIEIDDRSYMGNACVINGTIYAPGSAMDSSTLCEYCYCLGGIQRCVKPKCLLPVEGCTPVYSPNSCCPVHYNCTESHHKSSSTTTLSPEFLQDSCLVSGKLYPKGHKILGVGHSACDNCYCIRGLVRCEPLSCAPPLLGCLPVIKNGECCAASYNCSGTIETNPEPHYGELPIVSKEYAKFRKEATSKRESDKKSPYLGTSNLIPTTKANRISGYFGTTRNFNGNNLDKSTVNPYVKLRSTSDYPEVIYKPKEVEFRKSSSGKRKEENINDLNPREKIKNPILEDFDGRFNRRYDNQTESTTNLAETTETTLTTEYFLKDESTTDVLNDTNPTEDSVTFLASTFIDFITQEFFNENTDEEVTTDTSTTVETTTSEDSSSMTLKTVLNTTDCIEEIGTESSDLKDGISDGNFEENLSKNANLNVENDVTIVDLESKVKVSTVTVRPLEKHASLISNKDKEDYDYYIRPNIEIIPFLPSDALDTKKKLDENRRNSLIEERVTVPNIYTFTNLFSPPNETQGGFVPKDPDIVSPITQQTKKTSCLSEGFEVQHGEAVTSKNVCVVCFCYYGDIVCQDPRCPPLDNGCRESSVLDRSTCCPRIICDDEVPQNLLYDNLEITSNSKDVITVADGIISQDPFKDVIKTEPAPNLIDLMRDTTTHINNVTILDESTTKSSIIKKDESSFMDSVVDLLFGGKDEKTTEIATVIQENVTEVADKQKTEELENDVENMIKPNDNIGVGPLKLAGCNIYGRMYRVGKIISELSGPCLECKCTEIGVQCQKLC